MSLSRRAGARIAVTGVCTPSSAARSFLRAELDGVRFLDLAAGDDAWTDDALGGADMLVFVADSADSADAAHLTLGDAARARGVLVAAVVVDRGRSHGRSPLLEVLRGAADMVMIVRDAGDVHAVVAALR